jgi:hypothetical protein
VKRLNSTRLILGSRQCNYTHQLHTPTTKLTAFGVGGVGEKLFEREWEAQEREDERMRVRDPDEKYWKAGIYCTEESEPVQPTSNLEIFVYTCLCVCLCKFAMGVGVFKPLLLKS